jgi:hypothetical protein
MCVCGCSVAADRIRTIVAEEKWDLLASRWHAWAAPLLQQLTNSPPKYQDVEREYYHDMFCRWIEDCIKSDPRLCTLLFEKYPEWNGYNRFGDVYDFSK